MITDRLMRESDRGRFRYRQFPSFFKFARARSCLPIVCIGIMKALLYDLLRIAMEQLCRST